MCFWWRVFYIYALWIEMHSMVDLRKGHYSHRVRTTFSSSPLAPTKVNYNLMSAENVLESYAVRCAATVSFFCLWTTENMRKITWSGKNALKTNDILLWSTKWVEKSENKFKRNKFICSRGDVAPQDRVTCLCIAFNWFISVGRFPHRYLVGTSEHWATEHHNIHIFRCKMTHTNGIAAEQL